LIHLKAKARCSGCEGVRRKSEDSQVEPHGLKPVVPPPASKSGTLRSRSHYAPSSFEGYPVRIHPRPKVRGFLRRRVNVTSTCKKEQNSVERRLRFGKGFMKRKVMRCFFRAKWNSRVTSRGIPSRRGRVTSYSKNGHHALILGRINAIPMARIIARAIISSIKVVPFWFKVSPPFHLHRTKNRTA
jgi:hypothetical protein